MIRHQQATINPKKSITFENLPDMAALRAVWRSLRTEEATAHSSCRLGIAVRRQELLSAFPAWQIPSILDQLNQPEAEEVFV